MDKDLVDEIEYLIDLLTKSGFFSKKEILEILQDQFIDENIDFSRFNISFNDSKNHNFSILEEVFKNLATKSIVAVHNCGYDFSEGVDDIFELYIHLVNNSYSPLGFCFYTFEDVEEAISENTLKITFGDFNRSENDAFKIGQTIFKYLKEANFDVKWNESINNPIEIHNFVWDKKYLPDKEYELEGAYDVFIGVFDEN